MDGRRAVAQSPADVQIFVARWAAGLHEWNDGRGGAVHHVRLARCGSCQRYSTLGLLHAVAKEPAGLDRVHDLELDHRHWRRNSRDDRRGLDVFAEEALSIRRRVDGNPLPWSETMALDLRDRVWSCDRYMDLQRTDVARPLPADATPDGHDVTSRAAAAATPATAAAGTAD